MLNCNDLNCKYQTLFSVGASWSHKDLQNQFSDCVELLHRGEFDCSRSLMWWGNMSGFNTAVYVDGVSL